MCASLCVSSPQSLQISLSVFQTKRQIKQRRFNHMGHTSQSVCVSCGACSILQTSPTSFYIYMHIFPGKDQYNAICILPGHKGDVLKMKAG